MSADDYAIGKSLHQTWINSNSIVKMFCEVIDSTINAYFTWRGSYTLNFFDCWNPGFFGEEYVWMTPIFMIIILFVSSYFFVDKMIAKFYDCSSKHRSLVSLLFIFLVIETMPSPVEGFYWYAGAIAYTFSQCLMIFFFGIFLSIEKKRTPLNQFVYMLFLVLLSVILGGCQYTTVLESIIWYLIIIFIDKNRLDIKKIVPFLGLVVGFIFNLMAPGNSLRQVNTMGMNPIMSILYSFVHAFSYMKLWTSPLLIGLILLIIPVIWRILLMEKRKFRYPYPILVCFLSFCVYSSCFTAPLYGVGNVDSGRIQNQIQFMFYIILLFNIFYILGWIYYKINHTSKGIFEDIKKLLFILYKYRIQYRWGVLFIVLFIFIGTSDKNTFSSISAMRSLVKGEAREYYNESMDRLLIYKDESITVAEVFEYSVKPKVLYFNEIQIEGSPNYWINESIAAYYNKQKVVLIYKDQ